MSNLSIEMSKTKNKHFPFCQVDSVMSMTPFSDDFISARVHNIYTGNASQGAPGVFVNMTIQLDGNTETARGYIQSDLQKQLIAVIHRRNNNIGNSALYVDQPAGAISSLHGMNSSFFNCLFCFKK